MERSAVLPVPLLPQLSMLQSAGGSTCLVIRAMQKTGNKDFKLSEP